MKILNFQTYLFINYQLSKVEMLEINLGFLLEIKMKIPSTRNVVIKIQFGDEPQKR